MTDLLMIRASDGVTILTREIDLIECDGEVWLSTRRGRSINYDTPEAAIEAVRNDCVEWQPA